jgi:hypothetical protein
MPAPKPAPYSFATTGAPAPWKVAARDGSPPLHPLARPHVVAAGRAFALLRAQGGWFAADQVGNIQGPLPVPPETVWMGMDGDDVMYAATREGALFRAATLASLTAADPWKPRATLAHPTSWDATAGLVIAATQAGVHLSTNGGASFQLAKVPSGFSPHAALARPDGVIVVTSEGGASPPIVSTDRGRTWRPATIAATQIKRAGSRIEATAPCPAVLAKDGKTWLAAEPLPAELAAKGWEHAVEVSTVAMALPETPRQSVLAPAAPDAKGGAPAPSTCERSQAGSLRAGSAVAEGPPCQFAECLRGATEAPPDPTPTELDFVGVATCPASADGKCADDAPHVREPSLAFADPDKRTMRIVKLPEGCRAARTLSAGGLSLLACADGASTKLFAGDPSTPFALETTLPVPPSQLGSLALAVDGTLLLRASWDTADKRAAFVRSPVSVGASNAWRSIAMGDALELRVAPGGSVLVLTAAPDDALSIALDASDGRKVLFPNVRLEGHLVDASLESGRLVLWTLPQIHRGRVLPGTPAARGDAQGRWLSVAGTLER